MLCLKQSHASPLCIGHCISRECEENIAASTGPVNIQWLHDLPQIFPIYVFSNSFKKCIFLISVLVAKHRDEGNLWKKAFDLKTVVFAGLEYMTSKAPGRQIGRRGAREVVERLHPDLQVEGKEGRRERDTHRQRGREWETDRYTDRDKETEREKWTLRSFKFTPSDTPPPTRTQLLILLKWFCQQWTKD